MNRRSIPPPPLPMPNGSSHVRISDIAKECGLSVMTVSRAIRNAYGVKAATRERVMATAERMGYIRNQIASNLVQRRTHMIGVLIPEIDRTIFPAVLNGIESVFSPARYGILLTCSYDDIHREEALVQQLLEQRVDGFAIAPAQSDGSRATIERIQRHGRPLVLFDRLVESIECDSITVDDFEGARKATQHLLDQGFRRIVHLAGPPNVWVASQRAAGFRAAIREAGMQLAPDALEPAGLIVEEGAEAMERVLSRERLPDAIFCVNDPVAMGAYKVLVRHNVEVPRQMALVGFADSLEAEIMGVPLTTVAQDSVELGRQAARLLLERVRDDSREVLPPRHQVVQTRLVVRASSLRVH